MTEQTLSQEVNPNVEVGETTPTEITATEVVSFDDLESVMETSQPGTKVEEPGQKPQKEQEAAADTAEAGEGGENADGDKILPGSEERASQSAEVKPIKIKSGEKELDLLPDAVIPTKVAGQQEMPTLQDLRDNYAGKVNWDRRNNELANREKKFNDDYQVVNQQLTRLMRASEEGDVQEFVNVLAKMNGVDPLEMEKRINEPFEAAARERAKMSEEEYEASLKDKKLAAYEKREKARREQNDHQTAVKQWVDHAEKIRDEHHIEKDVWEEMAGRVIGERDFRQVNPMEIVHHKVSSDSWRAIAEAMPEKVAEYEKLAADYEKNGNPFVKQQKEEIERDVHEIWTDLTKHAISGKLTPEEISEIAKETFGTQKQKKAARDLSRKVRNTQSGGPVARSKPAAEDPISFDQI